MTKAQEKRNTQFRDSLTRRLTVLFNPFRNHNYISYVNSKIRPFQKTIDSFWGTFEGTDDAYEAVKDKTYGELKLPNGINPRHFKTDEARKEAQEKALAKIVSKYSVQNKMREVGRARSVMSLLEIHRLEWLEEVKLAFDGRFGKMVDKMCGNMKPKNNNFKIEVEELSNSWSEFSVLIHIEDTTFHARAIWVEGTQMISHYRFITTTRKKK
jgi:hypothetical protein